MKLLDLQAQYRAYQSEIDEAMRGVIAETRFIGGPVITELERGLSIYSGAPYAIGCSSGTDALLLALMALGVGPGDEVITTPYSFIATAEVIMLLRAVPVFADVDPDTFNIDLDHLAPQINEKTKAVIPVSLFGQTADMEAIGNICQERGIPVIEDAAQSFGADHGNRKSGNLSVLAATSFFPAKPLGCYGDGGAVFTQSEELAAKIRMLLNHGQSRQYYHDYIGINGRLDALQAAVLSVKLKHLDRELEARNRIADYYHKEINPEYFRVQTILPGRRSAYAQYCLTIAPKSVTDAPALPALPALRQKIRDFLAEKGIPTAVYYPVPIHLQKPFLEAGYQQGDFPVSEELSGSMFAIPIHPFLTDQEMADVAAGINAAGEKFIDKFR